MWSRVVEVMLGCWLLMSPFIFRHGREEVALWTNDFACGSAVIVFGLLSYWRPTRHAHLLSLGVGLWMIVFAYWLGWGSAPPAAQNYLIVGVVMLMFAVIPNDATEPPEGWDEPPPEPAVKLGRGSHALADPVDQASR